MRTKRYFLPLVLVLALALTLGVAHAQDKKVIKIASQGPLSGGLANSGIAMRNSVELAIDQLSGPLTDMGFDIQFVPFDDQATPDVGVSNANLIVADPAILAVIGHFNSGVAIPSSEVYKDYDLVMVSPANTNAKITDRGLPTVNRVCGRDDLQGPVGADFAATLKGVKSVYVLNNTNAYGVGVSTAFKDEAEKIGLNVLGFEGTAEKSNFDSVVQPILALSPDLVYYGGEYDVGGPFFAQLRAAGYEGYLLMPDGAAGSDIVKLAGDAIKGAYYTTVAAPSSVYPDAAQFEKDYQAKFGMETQPFAAQAYDATGIVLKAIETAATEANGALPTRKAISEAVRATKDYKGITATITFDSVGDPEVANYYILQINSSDPAKFSDAVLNPIVKSLQLPSPAHAKEMAEPAATTSP